MSFIEFEPLRLTDESAQSLKDRLATQSNFGGLAVHGVGWFISDHMPEGISQEDLPQVADQLAQQVGCSNVSSSIIQKYTERTAA